LRGGVGDASRRAHGGDTPTVRLLTAGLGSRPGQGSGYDFRCAVLVKSGRPLPKPG
jgi:hypothetical protein